MTFGEPLGPLLADDGLPLRRARSFRRTVAGAELTTAVGLARLGRRCALEARVAVSFDPNVRARLWSRADAAPVLRELAAQARIVLAGEDEARWLAGLEDAAQLAAAGDWFHARGAELDDMTTTEVDR